MSPTLNCYNDAFFRVYLECEHVKCLRHIGYHYVVANFKTAKETFSIEQNRLIYDKVCPGSIQPCTVKNRDIYMRRYRKHCTQDNDASVPFKVGTLGSHTILPVSLLLFQPLCKILCWNRYQLSHIFLNYIGGLKSLPFQR